MTAATIPSSEITWEHQNQLGRDQADDLVRRMSTENAPNLLGPAIKEMIERGVYTGVEVGFCHRLAAHLLAG